MPGQQLVHRDDERVDAVAQQLVGDVVEVDPGVGERAQVVRRVVRGGRAGDVALVGGGPERRQRHRVDRVGRDEAVDVQRVRVRRVLHAGRGPQRPLDRAARRAQRGELVAAEHALERLVGGAGVGEAGAALEILAPGGGQPLVDLGVDARDEERGDRVAVERQPFGAAALHRADVRAHDVLVRRDAEQQRHVDVHALVQRGLDRRGPRARGGDLDHQVRPVDQAPVHAGLLDRPVGVVREARGDLERHVAVDAVRVVVDGAQHVGRELHVADGQAAVDLPRGEALLRGVGDVGVVVGRPEDRLLEDRGVGGHAAERVLLHHPPQLAALDHPAADLVQPDAGARGGQRREPLVDRRDAHALFVLSRTALARSATASPVNPKCW